MYDGMDKPLFGEARPRVCAISQCFGVVTARKCLRDILERGHELLQYDKTPVK